MIQRNKQKNPDDGGADADGGDSNVMVMVIVM